MQQVDRVYTGTIWESEVAYCRAKKIGNYICVSGTTPVNSDGETVGNNLYEQTVFSFNKGISAIEKLGGDKNSVIRTRMFVTDISDFDSIARAHKEIFQDVDPAATCVEVTRLVKDEYLIEIEIDAIVE